MDQEMDSAAKRQNFSIRDHQLSSKTLAFQASDVLSIPIARSKNLVSHQ
jgi:hypothetical protein